VWITYDTALDVLICKVSQYPQALGPQASRPSYHIVIPNIKLPSAAAIDKLTSLQQWKIEKRTEKIFDIDTLYVYD
jgi:hypothetical protein